MERERAIEPAVEAHTPPAPAKSDKSDLVSIMLHAQAHGGNQMVARAVADNPIEDRLRGRLGGGRPLPAEVRAETETGFGQPLGDVRVHTDGHAASMATELNANAFTVGQDIFFGQGQFDPSSRSGYNILAHELTHTLQQPTTPAAAGLTVSDVHDPEEREAYAIADRLTAHRGSTDPMAASLSGPVSPGVFKIHRHSSWEHTLLGDTPPSRLGDATVTAEARKHVLADLWERMMFFSTDPGGDPRARFPDVRWVQLAGSSLWVSNGELNALADYLPDPSAADTMTREELVPVLQKMRSGIRGAAGAEFGLRGKSMEGMATHWMEFITEAGGEVKALDEATAGQGTNRYAGLLTRNACHFAPFSWHRWEQYHNEAVEEAKAHFASRSQTAPLKDIPKGTEEHARQAILKNGYGDHFLQDSFAAGHLVNKTLVMQWWIDYLNQATLIIPGTDLAIIRRGQPDPDVMARMASARQTGIAGQSLYGNTPTSGPTNRDDRESGTSAIDPQTAQERRDREGRVAGSGVTGVDDADREANYQAYLRLLNNAQAQGAAGAAHDYFNKIGLTVMSSDGSVRMRVGGDDTLISQSGPVGAETAANAAAMSRRAIDELMNTGATELTTEKIFAMVPTAVVPDGPDAAPIPLDQWQSSVLHDLCFNTIFPEYYRSITSAIIGTFGAEMVPGGMSQDSGKAPPPVKGDFPAPVGPAMG
ncbi:DUF4157 domain-containing protein [Actinoplanes sp. NPDC051633]|uniref:eCIS core domain-containing protein n=1 Tax=Actinoplanes sp. NPDC051633 TaxID=3155670 RepID=UPI003432FD29